jgi:hypothetical protein
MAEAARVVYRLPPLSRFSGRRGAKVFCTSAMATTPISGVAVRNAFGYPVAHCRGSRFMICPQCRSADCFRSHRSGMMDFVFTLAGCRPWRCHTCDRRFYSWRVALSFSRFAHCPRCGNFDLERISRDRVEDGTMFLAKRLLHFPAYRCDPCRERFFSIRPVRRILPSMPPGAERKDPVAVGGRN